MLLGENKGNQYIGHNDQEDKDGEKLENYNLKMLGMDEKHSRRQSSPAEDSG